jgi:hypothetical protein
MMAPPCNVFDVGDVVFDKGSDPSKKSVPMMTVQRVRECIGELLVHERLAICSQDEYICFCNTLWLNRTKLASEYAKNKQN